VLEVEDARVEAGDRLLVRKGTFAIERGQRVALIGPNGTGKTSLVESLLGIRRIAGGKVRMGHNVTASYFSQHEEELPSNSTVLEAMAAGTPLNQNQARTLLGKFLFSGDTVERKVSVLSGGERRRLSLARLVASGANFLVLDEPTNHLDVESREALEDAIEAYDGTVLFVSHDRALIDAVATHTLALEDQALTLRIGDYNDFMAAKEQAAAPPPPPPAPVAFPAAGGDMRAIIIAAWAPLGPAVVSWALRLAQCESNFNPYAVNRSSGAAGLFQFLATTWAGTPWRAQSPFDPNANALAAAWLYSKYGPGQWSCKV
jgi:ABC-type Mn2+/Zn2+ transport system ATPase subunit